MTESRTEFDQYFSDHRNTVRHHPEDDTSSEPEPEPEPTNDPEDSDYADENPHISRSNTTIPLRKQYANTGVKGVIADAQAFSVAQKSSRRSTDTDDFTVQWRQQRLAELQASTASAGPTGRFTKVSAETYVEVVEDTPASTFVVVLIWDFSEQSDEVEDELRALAYANADVRFIGLRWDVAEVKDMAVPSLLVYRGGQMVRLVDGVRGDSVKRKLNELGVLSP